MSENVATCDVCKKAVHSCSNTTNLFKHLITREREGGAAKKKESRGKMHRSLFCLWFKPSYIMHILHSICMMYICLEKQLDKAHFTLHSTTKDKKNSQLASSRPAHILQVLTQHLCLHKHTIHTFWPKSCKINYNRPQLYIHTCVVSDLDQDQEHLYPYPKTEHLTSPVTNVAA